MDIDPALRSALDIDSRVGLGPGSLVRKPKRTHDGLALLLQPWGFGLSAGVSGASTSELRWDSCLESVESVMRVRDNPNRN